MGWKITVVSVFEPLLKPCGEVGSVITALVSLIGVVVFGVVGHFCEEEWFGDDLG